MQRGAGSGVIQRFLAFLDDYNLNGRAVGVAFSGGRDSSALAVCAAEARNAVRLAPVLVHVDHGVRPDSAEDRAVVGQTAAALDLELETIDLKELTAESTEAEMREARYRALHDVLSPLGIHTVLTGHHARDQAETVLLHLARGQGLEGAAGISPAETLRFGPVLINAVRPFLDEEPGALADLVAAYGLRIVEDRTNELTDRARNLVRHEVLTLLSEINPGAIQNMARSAEILRDENLTLAMLAGEAMGRLAGQDGLDGARLGAEPIAIQRRVIRVWVGEQTGMELTFDRTEAVRQLASAGTGNVMIELGEGWCARQDKRRITLHRDA